MLAYLKEKAGEAHESEISHVVYNDSVLCYQEIIEPPISRNRKMNQKNTTVYCACSDIFF